MPHFVIQIAFRISVRTEEFSLQVAFALDHKNADREEIVFVKAAARIGKVEQPRDPQSAVDPFKS